MPPLRAAPAGRAPRPAARGRSPRAPARPRPPSSRARRARRGRRGGRARRDDGRERRLGRRAELLLQLEHDPLGGLLADPGDRLEARVVAERDRPAQLARRASRRRRRARPSGPIPLTVSRCDEQLALRGVGEPVELQRVLAHVEVGLDRHLARALGAAQHGRRRGDEVADAVDVEDEPVGACGRRAGRAGARSRAPSRRHPRERRHRARGRSRPRARRPRATSAAPRRARAASAPSAAPGPCRRGRSRRPPA